MVNGEWKRRVTERTEKLQRHTEKALKRLRESQ